VKAGDAKIPPTFGVVWDWQQHSWGSDGGWSHVRDSGATRSLDDEWASRFNGSERMNAFRSNFGEMGGRFGGGRSRRR
jgi:hypothetical protein